MENKEKYSNYKILIHKEDLLHISKHLAYGFNSNYPKINALGVTNKDNFFSKEKDMLIITDAYSKEFVLKVKEQNSKIMFFASNNADELIEKGFLKKSEIIGGKTFTGEIYKLIADKYEELTKKKKRSDKYVFKVGGKIIE